MTSVWKFPLARTDVQQVVMPTGAEILHVGTQDGGLMLWARVDTHAPTAPRLIAIVGTGQPAPDWKDAHIGTVLVGAFVWHVFAQVHE